MLYDTKWDKDIKTDPWSVESIIAWLETKNPRKGYSWHNPYTCIMAQYAIENNLPIEIVLPVDLCEIAWGGESFTSKDGMSTFGRALKRARKIVAGRK